MRIIRVMIEGEIGYDELALSDEPLLLLHQPFPNTIVPFIPLLVLHRANDTVVFALLPPVFALAEVSILSAG